MHEKEASLLEAAAVLTLEAKMEQDFLSVALSHETEARKKKSQSEEEWVEAEIGRLLHHAEVDDEDEARSSPTSELQVGFALSGYACIIVPAVGC